MPEPGTPALARGLLASRRCFHGYDDVDDGDFPFSKLRNSESGGGSDRLIRVQHGCSHETLEEYLKIKLFGRDYCIRFIFWPLGAIEAPGG